MFLSVLAVLALGTAEPAAAAPDEMVKKKDKLVCESVRPTGSRMAKRVCRTAEEVERNREATQRKFDNLNETKTKAMSNVGMGLPTPK